MKKKKLAILAYNCFFMEMMMKSCIKALAVVACLALSQTALARQVAVCYKADERAYPTNSITCQIGNDGTEKTTTLFEMTKAGWSIQAATPVQRTQERAGDPFWYETYIYLEKP